ncbi:tryptophan--tRNA ligase [Clostridia bacterium]|nr:tryptophan--tRNA ligase [Clostridia bacterium]
MKTMLTGIQPSGALTIGNYFGSIKNCASLISEYENFFFIADQHAITVRQTPADLRRRTLEMAAIYIASGLDPDKCALFVQSHVPGHSQLAWILNCNTMFGELSRMTQFKDKSEAHADNVNAGLFTYPALMAADILLYNTDLVPVGADQKQHMEITRDIAVRFNGIYGDVFTIPEPYIAKESAKIYSLQEPQKKMSKSDPNPGAFILLLEKRDDIIRKFKRAVTDSDSVVKYGEGKDGINNLIGIYTCATGKTTDEIEREFDGKGYGDFKLAVAEATADCLAPIQNEFSKLMEDKNYLLGVLKKGAESASARAERVLAKVYKKVGFLSL